MKSKRRHELQTNELADQLGQWIERVRPYTTLAIVIAAGAMLILAAWYYLAAARERKTADSWREYMLAGTDPQGDISASLSDVADQYGDTAAGHWAAMMAADVEADKGMRLMFTDRAAAETALNLAKSHYRQVLESKHAGGDAMLALRARFGLAQVHETQSELDQATEEYQKVVAGANDSQLGKVAQKRIDRLATATTKKWYNWFANQKPAPRNLGTGPGAGMPAGMPGGELNTLPEGPPEDFMKGGTTAAPKSDASTTTGEPATETPTGPALESPAAPVPGSPVPESPAGPPQETPAAPAAGTPAQEAPTEPGKDAPADQSPPG